MDGVDLEPSYRLYQDQPGMQELLRRAHGKTPSSNGAEELRKGIPAGCPRACSEPASPVGEDTHYLRQLHERSFPSEGPGNVYPPRF